MRFVKNQPQLEQAILDLISPHLEDPNSKLRQLVDQDCVPGFKFLDKHKLQRIDENAIARSYISILHGPSGSGKSLLYAFVFMHYHLQTILKVKRDRYLNI